MQDKINQKKAGQTTGANPVNVAVTGALIGAVVTGAILMSNKDNQEKVAKIVNDTKKKIKGTKKGLEEKSQAVQLDAKEKIGQVNSKVKKLIDVAKEPLKE